MNREAERKRLIETLSWIRYKAFPTDEKAWEFIADRLLDDGVIVPPCKVGDKVYVTDMYEKQAVVTECEVLGYDAIDENGIGIMEYKPCVHVPYISSVSCFLDDIGKTVFLTREQAEKALEGKGE